MEDLARSDPESPDADSLIQIMDTAGGAFEIHVPVIFNRSVQIETSTDLSHWQLWNTPGNTPDYPATGGGVKTLGGTLDGNARFFRANVASP